MGTITAAEVSKLRQSTGAGMMDCKKALVEAEGDFDKAVEILRKKGQKVAAKRADRENSEGAVIAKVNADKTKGVVISVNCETDFVAKNENFVKLAHDLAEKALSHDSLESFLASDFGGVTVADKLVEQTGVIGEKVEVKVFESLSSAYVGAYIHAGNQIASLVALSGVAEGAEEVSKDVAMQVVAMNPLALDESSVSKEVIEKELEIAKDQLRQEGKPEEMLDKIAQGKLSKFFKENTLIHQAFIKDAKQSVEDYVKTLGDIKVDGYKRVSLV